MYIKKFEEKIIRSSLKNLNQPKAIRIPKFNNTVQEKATDATKLLGKINEKVKSVISNPDFGNNRLDVKNVKEHLSIFDDVNEGLKLIPIAQYMPSSKFQESSINVRNLITQLEKSIEDESLEFKKDVLYMKALNKAYRYVSDNIFEILKIENLDCFYAISSINELLSASSNLFIDNLENLINYIREIKRNEHKIKKEAVKSKQELLKKFESLVKENEKLKQLVDDKQDTTCQDVNVNPNQYVTFSNDNLSNNLKNIQSCTQIGTLHTSSLKSYDKVLKDDEINLRNNSNLCSNSLLSVNELKSFINNIIESKRQYDDLCDELKLKFETMKTFMKIYLNDKYPNTNAIKEFNEKFEKSLAENAKKDIDVFIFRSVYENIIDEEFLNIVEDIKTKLRSYLRVI